MLTAANLKINRKHVNPRYNFMRIKVDDRTRGSAAFDKSNKIAWIITTNFYA
jgi:hypothetical protein